MKLKNKLEALGFKQNIHSLRQYSNESCDLCVYVDDNKISGIQIVTSWHVASAPFDYKDYFKKVSKIFKKLSKLL